MPQEPSSLPQGLAREYSGLNRRACIRYRCNRPIPRRMALAESFTSLDAWVVDISLKGLGLLLDRPLENGTLLFVELEATPAAPPVELLANISRPRRRSATASGSSDVNSSMGSARRNCKRSWPEIQSAPIYEAFLINEEFMRKASCISSSAC